MKGKYKNSLNHSWKMMKNDQMRILQDKVHMTFSRDNASGAFIRKGYLGFGAVQMVNYLSNDYLRMGGKGGGVVG